MHKKHMVAQRATVPFWCNVGCRIVYRAGTRDGRPGLVTAVNRQLGVVTLDLDDGSHIEQTRADTLVLEDLEAPADDDRDGAGAVARSAADAGNTDADASEADDASAAPTQAASRFRPGQRVFCNFQHTTRGRLWYAGLVVSVKQGSCIVRFMDNDVMNIAHVSSSLAWSCPPDALHLWSRTSLPGPWLRTSLTAGPCRVACVTRRTA